MSGAPGSWNERLVAAAERVVDDDLELAALLMLEAVGPYMATGDIPAFIRTARRAHALAQQIGEPVESAAASMLASGLLVSGEDREEAIRLRSSAHHIASEPLWRAAPEVVGAHALASSVLGDHEGAESLFETIVEGARQTGAVRSLYYPLASQAVLRFRLGRWPAALADAEEAVSLCREFADSAMLAYTMGVLALVEAGLGRQERAAELAHDSIAKSESLGTIAIVPWAVSALALQALAEGDAAAALSHFERIDATFARRIRARGWYCTAGMRIEAHIRTGDRITATGLLAELRRDATWPEDHWSHAVAERCEGLLAADDAFDASFQAARAAHARLPMPFERARTELCYGERLRRVRRRADARAPLTHAAETFRSLGARVWLERAERELAATGARRRPTRSTLSPWSELTAAETRVAREIIEGATYDEAAGKLFVSPRTVDAHLRQIYRKLGVRSRTELTRLLIG